MSFGVRDDYFMIVLKYYFSIEPRCAEHVWLDGETNLYNHVSEIDLKTPKSISHKDFSYI